MDERSGIPEEFWEILEKYRQDLVIQARGILDNIEDAEDVVQETFCAAVKNPAKIADARSLPAYLKGINRYNALTRARSKRHDSKRLVRQQNLAPEQTFTTGGFNVLELRDSVKKAMEQLPDDLQQIVRLRYFEHLSYKEISERLNIPIGNVSGLLMDAFVRMYSKLRVQLGPAAQGTLDVRQAPPTETGEQPVTGN